MPREVSEQNLFRSMWRDKWSVEAGSHGGPVKLAGTKFQNEVIVSAMEAIK